MRPKRKDLVPVVPLPEVSAEDRIMLTGAFKAGLILSWRGDIQRGICLTRGGRQDECVEVNQLKKYLEKLKAS